MNDGVKVVIAAFVAIVSIILIGWGLWGFTDPKSTIQLDEDLIQKLIPAIVALVILIITIVPLYKHFNKQSAHRKAGDKLFNQGKYEEAYKEYVKSNVSKKRIDSCYSWVLVIKRKQSKQAEESGDYYKAKLLYKELNQTEDYERVKKAEYEKTLKEARLFEQNGNLEKALILYRKLDIEEDILRIEKKIFS
ncbi:hypothetical protein KAU33_05615 [Candidatus Dependentiae bacterium]|nr:hypothetical protein [Candidatus Dependentiae bacterium]